MFQSSVSSVLSSLSTLLFNLPTEAISSGILIPWVPYVSLRQVKLIGGDGVLGVCVMSSPFKRASSEDFRKSYSVRSNLSWTGLKLDFNMVHAWVL